MTSWMQLQFPPWVVVARAAVLVLVSDIAPLYNWAYFQALQVVAGTRNYKMLWMHPIRYQLLRVSCNWPKVEDGVSRMALCLDTVWTLIICFLQGMIEYYNMWLQELCHHLNFPNSPSQWEGVATSKVISAKTQARPWCHDMQWKCQYDFAVYGTLAG